MHSQGRVPPNLKCSLPRTECLVAQAVSCPKVSGQGGKSWTLLTEWCAPLQGYMPPEKGISFFLICTKVAYAIEAVTSVSFGCGPLHRL